MSQVWPSKPITGQQSFSAAVPIRVSQQRRGAVAKAKGVSLWATETRTHFPSKCGRVRKTQVQVQPLALLVGHEAPLVGCERTCAHAMARRALVKGTRGIYTSSKGSRLLHLLSASKDKPEANVAATLSTSWSASASRTTSATTVRRKGLTRESWVLGGCRV